MFERWEARHPLAARLGGMTPGLSLATALLDQDVVHVDDAALVEVVAGWERMISWASAAQAVAVAEMSRRALSSREAEFVGDEVASRLGVSRRSAELKVELATALVRAPVVHEALITGAIDVRKATVLTGETAHLAPSDAETLQQRFLLNASTTTAPQLRSAIRSAEQALDPAAAEKRHQRARAERSVTLTPAPCSMAWLTAYLPADDAMKVLTAVDALAASCGPFDDRGIDARRADALVDVMDRVLASGIGPHGPLPVRQHRRPHLQVTAAASTLLGLDEAPAALAGYGPIPASMARKIAAGSTWRAVLTDDGTGELVARSSTTYRPSPSVAGWVVDRDVTCTFPGCRVPAQRCDIDHIRPFDDRQPAVDQTTAENLHALCRHHHRLKTHGRWRPVRDASTGRTHWESGTGHRYTRDPVPTDPTDRPPRAVRPTWDAIPAPTPAPPPAEAVAGDESVAGDGVLPGDSAVPDEPAPDDGVRSGGSVDLGVPGDPAVPRAREPRDRSVPVDPDRPPF